MANSKPVKVDPEELEKAEALWGWFTQFMKWSVIITAVVLVLLGLLFVNWS